MASSPTSEQSTRSASARWTESEMRISPVAALSVRRVYTLKPMPADSPARSISRAKPAVLNGEPRSDLKTNADLSSCSR
jgi:hypothetical protein